MLDTPEDVALFWGDDGGGRRAHDALARTACGAAPVVIVALSSKAAYLDRYAEPDKGWTDRDEARWPVPYWDVDTGMAALLVLLTAVDEGLGACFFGIEERHLDGFRTAFGIPERPRADRRDHDRPPRDRHRCSGVTGPSRATRGRRPPRALVSAAVRGRSAPARAADARPGRG